MRPLVTQDKPFTTLSTCQLGPECETRKTSLNITEDSSPSATHYTVRDKYQATSAIRNSFEDSTHMTVHPLPTASTPSIPIVRATSHMISKTFLLSLEDTSLTYSSTEPMTPRSSPHQQT